jgi:hypothetical protein
MGRPKGSKKAKDDIRDHCMQVHVSESERKLIIQKAKTCKMSFSRYLRETAISSNDERLPMVRKEAISEIRKIGVNINQIAHQINQVHLAGGSINYEKYFTLLGKYNSELKEALKALII